MAAKTAPVFMAPSVFLLCTLDMASSFRFFLQSQENCYSPYSLTCISILPALQVGRRKKQGKARCGWQGIHHPLSHPCPRALPPSQSPPDDPRSQNLVTPIDKRRKRNIFQLPTLLLPTKLGFCKGVIKKEKILGRRPCAKETAL